MRSARVTSIRGFLIVFLVGFGCCLSIVAEGESRRDVEAEVGRGDGAAVPGLEGDGGASTNAPEDTIAPSRVILLPRDSSGTDLFISAEGERALPEAEEHESDSTPPVKAVNLSPEHAPIGSVTAWLKSMQATPPLAAGWVECSGQTLSDPESVYNGQVIPDLNGVHDAKRFLRGAEESGGRGGSERHYHAADRFQKVGDARKPVLVPDSVSHLPPYFEVVWIMRVK